MMFFTKTNDYQELCDTNKTCASLSTFESEKKNKKLINNQKS